LNVRAGHAIQIVHGSFRDPSLRITAIASALRISPTHLSRLIKKETGIGFRELCIKLRLAEAKRHLLDPTLSVKQAASLAGFNSTSNFDRDFRRLYGCSPTQWRARESRTNADR
jgi:AraC-like DNA-binding protein